MLHWPCRCRIDAPVDLLALPSNQGSYGASGALVHLPGMPAGGRRQAAGGSSVLVYFSCEDCALAAARVPAAGGRLKQPRMSIGPFGHSALAVDPEGNMIGLHAMQ